MSLSRRFRHVSLLTQSLQGHEEKVRTGVELGRQGQGLQSLRDTYLCPRFLLIGVEGNRHPTSEGHWNGNPERKVFGKSLL